MPTVDRVADGVLRLALRTPTLPPATSTNTLIVGHRRLAVIEPATPHAAEQAHLDAVLSRLSRDGARVVAVLITHHHADHTGYAKALRDRLGVPLYAHPATARRVSFAVDRELGDGDIVPLDGGHEIEAVFTPGHAPGHLVYVDRGSCVAHAGDMVAGEGFVMIDPDDDGDMAQYLASLRRLRGMASALVPAHGPTLTDPDGTIDHYVAHRLAREASIMSAVERGGNTMDAVLADAYADTPRAVWPLARRSLEAHLRKLEADGRVTRTGDEIAAA